MKRALFVDDERSVLVVLERILRPHSGQWRMTFAQGATEALAALDDDPVDVLVTDLRMPGIDGAQLLDIVREQRPEMGRIVLSAEVEETSPSFTAAADEFLSKPCDADVIIAALNRASALRSP